MQPAQRWKPGRPDQRGEGSVGHVAAEQGQVAQRAKRWVGDEGRDPGLADPVGIQGKVMEVRELGGGQQRGSTIQDLPRGDLEDAEAGQGVAGENLCDLLLDGVDAEVPERGWGQVGERQAQELRSGDGPPPRARKVTRPVRIVNWR